MDPNIIFISQSSGSSKDISGKITFTNIMNVIPKDNYDKPQDNWRKHNKTEWRWRFLEIPSEKNIRKVIEISYMKPDSNKRIYFNRYGDWVERDIDPIFDQFVTKQHYYYTN